MVDQSLLRDTHLAGNATMRQSSPQSTPAAVGEVTDAFPVLEPDTHNQENTQTAPLSKTGGNALANDKDSLESHQRSSTTAAKPVLKQPRTSKRMIRLEEKLKGIQKKSLFDTDGDVCHYNIVNPNGGPARSTRNAQKQLAETLPKVDKEVKRQPTKTAADERRPGRRAEPTGKNVIQETNHTTGKKATPAKRHQEEQDNLPGRQRKRRINSHGELLPKATAVSNGSPRGRGRTLSGDSRQPLGQKHGRGRGRGRSQSRGKGDGDGRSTDQAPSSDSQRETSEELPDDREPLAPVLTENLFIESPTSPLDQLRNDMLRERTNSLREIWEKHDAVVRELYHLEVHQSMLDYNPQNILNYGDERLLKFMQSYDLIECTNEKLKYTSLPASSSPNKHAGQIHPSSLIEMLQNTTSRGTAASQALLAREQAIASGRTTMIHTGSGIRRYIRQFPTLKDYLSSFVSLEDNEDLTTSEVDELVKSEIGIRERVDALMARGGFTTRLQAIANRRPQLERPRLESHYDTLISHVTSASKTFHNNAKYRHNAARKCAKAIDRYWESIRTHEERAQKEETRRMIRLAKWTAQQVKKKWKIVERVCEARHKELLKEKQAQEGRRHLEMILEHSEQMLGVRMEELTSRKTQAEVKDGTADNDHTDHETDSTPDDETSVHSRTDSVFSKELSPELPDDHFISDNESDNDEEELAELNADQNLSVEELRRKYMTNAHESSSEDEHLSQTSSKADVQPTQQDNAPADDEYANTVPENEQDDWIEEDGESEDDDAELDALTKEADMSIEELRKLYGYHDTAEESSDESDQEEKNDDTTLEHGETSEPSEVQGANDRGISNAAVEPQADTLSDDNRSREASETVKDKDVEMTEHLASVDQTMDIDDDDRTVTEYGSDISDMEDFPSSSRTNKAQTVEKNTQPEKEGTTQKSTLADEASAQHAQTAVQPTGTTLSTTKVDTKIPFLLRGVLREYQHVGLDWLASLYKNGLNGILADEMGLGKTIQTIALLAHLACEESIWGPHLIVVPTSVILNWEMELKRWLPGFKILTYYGNPKERKEKRFGWSKNNAFHVCITSYQLVLQDQNVFRRKAWQYLILDEAHHIKNFRSQRWQVLLNFNSARRLLLTGTPLQNNLMELWSLLYFLMPNGVSQSMPIGFANQKEFQEWFSHPVDRMIEGHHDMDGDSRAALQKLHTVLRPYLLRRLKADVEKQLPEKHEHIVYCRLSKRQRYLYDDFMGRAKTKETLASGNFLSIINCLMQLRKVCNHPDLFEEHPIVTSFVMTDVIHREAEQVDGLVKRYLAVNSDLESSLLFLNLNTTQNEHMSTSVAAAYDRLSAAKYFIKEIIKHKTKVLLAESRGVASSGYQDMRKYVKYREMQMHMCAAERWEMINYINDQRCARKPIYGSDLLSCCTMVEDDRFWSVRPPGKDARNFLEQSSAIRSAVTSYKDRIDQSMEIIKRFAFVTPAAVISRAPQTELIPSTVSPVVHAQLRKMMDNDILHPIRTRLSIIFPDKRLLQDDCGKLQKLDVLLRELAAGGHRALIFTQMTRVLDILEVFLNMHGYRYLRLDGATKVEQRQALTEQFNNDQRILVFILSTRSGGLGINLTGADTVIFYDSDWNPSMDKQCQDRTHRIGQTRDVHIYRFVTEFTVEENIFKKANQKRLLDNVVIQEGEFTDEYFNKVDWWRDLPEVTGNLKGKPTEMPNIDFEQALLEAEDDENDTRAAITARKEMNMDERDFDETSAFPHRQNSIAPSSRSASGSPGPSMSQPSSNYPPAASNTEAELDNRDTYSVGDNSQVGADDEEDREDEEMQLSVGHVDQYMLRFWESEMFGSYLGFGGLPETQDEPDRSGQRHLVA